MAFSASMACRIIVLKHSDQFLGMRVNLNGLTLAEIVAMALAPLVVTLSKGSKAYVSHTVHMPKSRGKIHPFLAAVLADRAVK